MGFVGGHRDEILDDTRRAMTQAADNLDFERAAAMRDRLQAMEKGMERQKVVSPVQIDQDVIAFAQEEADTCVQVLFIRGGRLVGREYFLLDNADETEDAEILSNFISQFYEGAATIPEEFMLPH